MKNKIVPKFKHRQTETIGTAVLGMGLYWELCALNLEPHNVVAGYSRVGVGRRSKIHIPVGKEHIFLIREIAWW